MSGMLGEASVNLKPGVEGDLRSLAVEIVDVVRGHTVEFSNQPEVHLLDYDMVERILVERIGARVKGKDLTVSDLSTERQERFDLLVKWAAGRSMVRLTSGTTAILVSVRPSWKAKVFYNGSHHTINADCIVDRIKTGKDDE